MAKFEEVKGERKYKCEKWVVPETQVKELNGELNYEEVKRAEVEMQVEDLKKGGYIKILVGVM